MNNKLSSICSLSLEIFAILKKEYEIYLTNEKKEFLNNLNINNFYKIIDNTYLPPIYFIGDKYYLNEHYNLDNIENLIPFLCLASLVNNINPLKMGLIEEELLYLKEKYNLNINTYFIKELEIASIVSKTLLDDIPFKVIFKETDTDIINYLIEEKGYNTGICYYNVSKKMKEIKNNKNNFIIDNNLDYKIVEDYLYDFIGNKVR